MNGECWLHIHIHLYNLHRRHYTFILLSVDNIKIFNFTYCFQAEIGCSSMIELECFLRQQQEQKRHQQHPYKQCLYTGPDEGAMPASVPVQYQRQTAGSPSSSSDALTAIVSLIDSLQRLQSPTEGGSFKADIDNNTVQDGTSTSLGSAAGGIELYKTELCRAYEERGQCRYGEKCQFAHGHADLRSLDRHPKYKTEMCRTYHSTGFCPYGSRCHFVHNELARSMATATTAAAAATDSTKSSSPPGDCSQKQQLAQQFVASMVSRNPLDTLSSSPTQMSQRGMLYPSTLSTASSMSMKVSSTGMYIHDIESVLLQHRRRQNLTLTLQSSSLGSGHLLALPGGQCRLSPPLSAGDSGFSSSTGSPALSEVFSPTMSPKSPQSYRGSTHIQRASPSTAMYGMLAQRDWNTPTCSSSSSLIDVGLCSGSISNGGVDVRSRHFFGV